MGYSTDETVMKYIGWVNEKVARKSAEFFQQEENLISQLVGIYPHADCIFFGGV